MADQPPTTEANRPDDPVRLALISYVRMEKDLPCPGCRYNIGGLPGLVCPECGREYRMSDLGARPRPAWLKVMRSGWGWLALVAWSALLQGWVSMIKPPASETARILFYGARSGGTGGVEAFEMLFLLMWFASRVSTVPRRRARAGDALLVAWGLMVFELLGVLATCWT